MKRLENFFNYDELIFGGQEQKDILKNYDRFIT